MSFGVYNTFQNFVRENCVLDKGIVVYDTDKDWYVAHEPASQHPDYKRIFNRVAVDGEWYWIVKKVAGFRPRVVN